MKQLHDGKDVSYNPHRKILLKNNQYNFFLRASNFFSVQLAIKAPLSQILCKDLVIWRQFVAACANYLAESNVNEKVKTINNICFTLQIMSLTIYFTKRHYKTW